jgi:hypothetical protein
MRRAGAIPVHPVLFAIAFVMTLFADSTATVEVLPRPLIVAAALALAVQVVLSAVVRDRDLGAYLALIGLLVLAGFLPLALIVIAVPIAVVLSAWVFRRVVPVIPWRRGTELFNVMTAGILVATVITSATAGILTSPAGARADLGATVRPGPDVYLILLDGYPRADTLQDDFGFDNAPFLARMEGLGFEVADESRSNYNATILTLASMLNGRQLHEVPVLGNPSKTNRLSQYRLLEQAINQGEMLDEFRALGYEVVTVPSPFSNVTLWSADRVLADGTVTEFEASVLQAGLLPAILSDAQRTLIAASLRDRVGSTLDRTVDLAAERTDRPKFVLSHVMSPHTPVLFTADGSPLEGPACFPQACGIFDLGWGDDAVDAAMAGQVEHLNGIVEDAVEGIIEASESPPVIVVFSDHGHRQLESDGQEMVRSLLMASTPGQAGLIPGDATPVNILPRILNGYHDRSIPMTSEESYVADIFEFWLQTMVRLDP